MKAATTITVAVTHPQRLTYPGDLTVMFHRAGPRAAIVPGGTIAVGDEVDEVRDAAA